MNRLAVLLLALACLVSRAEADEPRDFTQQQLTFFETKIRPVLVEHCYECHAAGAKIVQGGLRVDHRAGLLRGGDSGPAVVPKQAKQSLLLKALRYDEFQMPPKGKLPDSVIRDFEAWIAMGAPDPREAVTDPPIRSIDVEEGRKHWAFQPVTDPQLPAVRNESWPLDPLDHFILARLEAAGLQPVAEANRHTWLRRVSLDLTGLPPTPGEIDAFINDTSPQAFEAVVDRLLSSRAFGERWARHWLDLTGYADMIGTSNNVFAEHAWRYRDYLIEAYRKDKPFDRFVREQIAGDLLPAESPEERAENITATGFLMVGDVEIVEPDKAKMEADHIDTQVSKIGMAFLGMTLGCVRCHDHKFDPIALTDYYGIAGMLRSSPATHKIPFGVWSTLNSTELPETPEQLAARQKVEAEHEQKLSSMKAERDRLEAEKKAVEQQLTKSSQVAPQLGAESQSSRVAPQLGGQSQSSRVAPQLGGQAQISQVTPKLGGQAQSSRVAPQLGAASQSSRVAPQLEGQAQSSRVAPQLGAESQISQVAPQLGGQAQSSRVAPQLGGQAQSSRVAPQLGGQAGEESRSDTSTDTLTKRRDELAEQIKKLGPAIQHAEFFRSKVPKAFAMRDGEQPSDMPIYIRGNPYSPGAVVPRGTIQVAAWETLPEIPAGQSGRRQLADWLADRRNPLTARVMVNRIWQKLFGEGIVRSVDYFGTRGETPSHPQLLDHLATRFMQNGPHGWSQKQLIRSLVLSRTYRLSSTNDATAMQVDPDNKLLWRMNRERLDAEAIRDSLLAVSGELLTSHGGPALVLEEVENCGALVQQGVNPPNYNHRKPRAGEEFVRTIYLPVMRTNTATNDRIRTHFDFVNPAQIAGQRAQTVVPTQALFVMNNQLFRKRARALAEHLITEFPQSDVRLEQLWLRVFSRPITDTERSAVTTFLRQLNHAPTEVNGKDNEKANENVGESVAWQELCHSLLASNEFIFRL